YVKSCGKHPDADRLSVCVIDDGSGVPNQVVCGAPNIAQGLTIAFARVGAVIPQNQTVLKKGKLRGVDSCGMVCSAQELMLGKDGEGIIELESSLVPGTPIAQVYHLDHTIFDISITPNRSDCFNVRGIARDLAAYGLGRFIDDTDQLGLNHSHPAASIQIHDQDICPYFSVVKIKNVTNKPSPDWLRKRIEDAGQQSISALVDIMNYVMYDLGQPLHVFDAQQIKGGFHVQKAGAGVPYLALNEENYTLDGDIVISDDEKILSLAGIKGGHRGSSTMDTTEIFIEAALFNPIHIAGTGQRLKLFSDARARFERGIDPQMTQKALAKAVACVLDICGGQVVGYSESGMGCSA
ncbi:MAG: phenylalanine--tRNA ligase subunit beta, partial [Alphaproteobacteria bacterium]|nr:phenylalanine--tRNA ligase subunit beta [Alphaproteobacteria bacterium]